MKTILTACCLASLLLADCEKSNDRPTCTKASANCTGVICADLYEASSCDENACLCHGGIYRCICDQ